MFTIEKNPNKSEDIIMNKNYAELINDGKTYLGIELGSTRVKSVLIDNKGEILASGEAEWENQLKNKFWTYDLDLVWKKIQESYKSLKTDVLEKYDIKLIKIDAMGFSAMMHGYLAFDYQGNQLAEFRTWRNANTQVAADKLSELFDFNIPLRWSISHLYQAILNEEDHIDKIDFITTLAGYVHWKLTRKKVLGIGDASGMFPIDSEKKEYNKQYTKLFGNLLKEKDLEINLLDILPIPLNAGESAGELTNEGAKLLDPEGDLLPGSKLAPPEGDAGTGMVATNAIEPRSANISVGTSAFAMIVLEKDLSKRYPEIDVVTTPEGHSVAMVHINNCTTEINAWVNLFDDLLAVLNLNVSKNDLFTKTFQSALQSDEKLDDWLTYGYHSGENISGIEEGRPLIVRKPGTELKVSNFMRSLLESAFATLNMGMRNIFDEGIHLDYMVAHGGIFQTEGVAQKIVANAVGVPITVMKTANEGGAWGMAVLSLYLQNSNSRSLNEFLKEVIFKNVETIEYKPTKEDIVKYNEFVSKYEKGLKIEKAAIEYFK